jgi:hypothetical protein
VTARISGRTTKVGSVRVGPAHALRLMQKKKKERRTAGGV